MADITHVHVARAFVYLAVILDAFSRTAVGWTLRHGLDASVSALGYQSPLEFETAYAQSKTN